MRKRWVLLLLAAAVAAQEKSVSDYGRALDQAITKVEDGKYKHKDEKSAATILESVRAFGRAEWADSDYLTYVADRLLFVLARDPTPELRAAACEELARILDRLGKGDPELIRRIDTASSLRDAARINALARDLARLADGSRDPVPRILRELGKLTPGTMLSARQLVRAVAARPAAASDSPEIRKAHEEVARAVVWRCIVVALFKTLRGDSDYPRPDPSPRVRGIAGRALVAANLGVASVDRSRLVAAAFAKRGDRLAHLDRVLFVLAHDPAAGVRAAMCEELGRVKGALPKDTAAPDDAVGRGGWGMAEELAVARIDSLVGESGTLEAAADATGVEVASRVRRLARTPPPNLATARRIVRALTSPPVAGSKSAAVRLALEQEGPALAGLCIRVALDQVAHGRANAEADPDAEVRKAAAEACGDRESDG